MCLTHFPISQPEQQYRQPRYTKLRPSSPSRPESHIVMGNKISTVGTVVTAGVTFGQVKVLNDAVVDTANLTATHAEKTVVRHAGEPAVIAVATIGSSVANVASGVTFGQVQFLNDAVVGCAKHTAQTGQHAGAEIVIVEDGISDSVLVVGRIKGSIFYAVGDHERGERATKAVSGITGVFTGGVGGSIEGSPPGAVSGSVATGTAMDGIITGAEFVIHDEFKPCGNVVTWDLALNGKNADY